MRCHVTRAREAVEGRQDLTHGQRAGEVAGAEPASAPATAHRHGEQRYAEHADGDAPRQESGIHPAPEVVEVVGLGRGHDGDVGLRL